MKHHSIAFVLLALLMALPAKAQKAIDDAVTNYSTVGEFRFTSTVDRDPVTHQVKRTVRELSHESGIPGACSKMQKLFRNEMKNATKATEVNEGKEHSILLTYQDGNITRIYSLKWTNNDTFKVVIINNKK